MHKKTFWSLISVVTLFSLWFCHTYFDKAIPFVGLSITMDKQQAEQKGQQLAKNFDWQIENFHQAVQFNEDAMLQSFVELEGGGKQAFKEMIQQDHHQPFVWQVRFFKEKVIKELSVWFTPTGKRYGFHQKVPEDEPGDNVSKSKAQRIAEDGVQEWNVNLEPYKLVEYEQQVRPSKRIDHSFVYERTDITLNKGLYRLHVTVSGDKLTGVKHLVKIPDEFNRRYQEMRSANILITVFGQGLEFILYLFIIAMIALFFLYKRRYLLVVETGKMMQVFAGITVLASLNTWPLVWNHYDTTISMSVFISQKLAAMILGPLLFTIFVGFICLVTEAMSRYVFRNHVQFFKLWSTEVAGTYTILEQTVLGYCGAVIMLAFMLSFYMVADGWGWWSPLMNKVDPNVLSTHIPFFSPVVKAFQAGFWEEFSSRALPIAGILLLSRNWKHKNVWFWTMIITQAILFGAAHANYPMQPAYYRVVEIFIPSLGFAWVYYVFGLLPGIITHGVYDAVYFLLPVFASSLLIQKVLGVLMVGIPLWVVLARWVMQGGLKEITKSAYNSAFEVTQKPIEDKKIVREVGKSIPDHIKKYSYVFGVVGLLFFITSKEFQFDTPAITISKEKSESIAKQAVLDRFGDIGSDWNTLNHFIDNSQNEGNKFVWQEYGRIIYQKLLGSFVVPPYYSVRFAKFRGPVEDRAEEYGVWVTGAGDVLNVLHKLPEAREGEDILESKAQKIAYDFIEEKYGLSSKDVELVSSDSVKHENRRDWKVIFKDLVHYSLEKGQGRIVVSVAGDEVVTCHRFVYAPEEWKRKEQERLNIKGILQSISYAGLILLLVLFTSFALLQIGISGLLLRMIGLGFLILMSLRYLALANRWDQILYTLSTAQPLANQISSTLMSFTVISVASAGMIATVLIAALLLGRKGLLKDGCATVTTGIALGCGVLGLFSLLGNIEPLFTARIPMYDFVNFKSSVIAILLGHWISDVVWGFVIIAGLWKLTQHKFKQDWYQILTFFIVGLSVVGSAGGVSTLWFWVLLGTLWAVVWYVLSRYVFDYNSELLLITLTTVQCLRLIPSAWYYAYPMIMMNVAFGGAVSLLVTWYLCRRLQAS